MRPASEQLWYNRFKNWLQTLLIVAGLALVLAVAGWILAGAAGAVWSMLLVAATAFIGSRIPARLILARSGAGLLHRRHAPALYDILHELYRRAGLNMEPALFYVPSPALNAFAVGDRRDGGIAISDGLLRALDYRQLAGVLAHEVSHLSHNDTRVMSMAATITQLTIMGATVLQMLLLIMLPWVLTGELQLPWLTLLFVTFAPTASTLLQLALSRNREFTADLEAVALTGDTHGLASALEVLERNNSSWLETLFGRTRPALPRWLHTHPPTRARIRRLLELGGTELREPVQPPLRTGIPSRFVTLQRPQPLGMHYWLTRRR